jgi:16S rRNA G966 N2-methylase RsmD
LKALGITKGALVQRRSASSALNALEQASREFDIVFFDPPYSSSLYDDVMARFGSGNLLAPGGIVVVEHRAKAPLQSQYDKLHRVREVKQGESALTFYSPAEEDASIPPLATVR